jgi:hypothetical protein
LTALCDLEGNQFPGAPIKNGSSEFLADPCLRETVQREANIILGAIWPFILWMANYMYASGEGRAGLHVIPFKFGKEVAQAVDAVL